MKQSTAIIFCVIANVILASADVWSQPVVTKSNSSNAFNPSIGLILNGTYSSFDNDPEDYEIPGFALGEETDPGARGFSLGETELSIKANVDERFYGSATIALTPEGAAEVEEAYLETLALGEGFTIKAGRFFSGAGYLNSVHAHAWDFVDQPLVYRALLGNQLGDDGIQGRWVAPTDVFVELGGEVLRGDGFPAGGADHDGTGTSVVFIHVGGDMNVSNSWRAGAAHINASAMERETGDTPDVFTGDSKVNIIDLVWKWAPLGNPVERNAKVQFEYFTRSEDGTFDTIDYNGDQSGWYLQGVYQFMRKWRAGVRHDALQADDVGVALAGTVLDNQGHDPSRTSVMVDYSNSEFSRVRLQFNKDDSGPESDNQWYVQYLMSLGAHGAHQF